MPREQRFEVSERMGHDGKIVTPLTPKEVDRVIGLLCDADVEAVAISLIHAYANDTHEETLRDAIETALPNLFVTLSSDVCREFREFERTSTTVISSRWVRVVVRSLVSMPTAPLRSDRKALVLCRDPHAIIVAASYQR